MAASVGQLDFMEMDLSSERGAALLRAVGDQYGETIVSAAGMVRRLFLLRSPWAPGLCFVGGQTTYATSNERSVGSEALSLSGTAERLEEAFVSCVGEAVERLALFERAGDIRMRASFSELRDQLMPDLAHLIGHQLAKDSRIDLALDWMQGRILDPGSEAEAGRATLVPADWCVQRLSRSPRLQALTMLSTGVAAGPTWDWAASRAMLELVERDAASLWWAGGRRGRRVKLDDQDAREIARLLGSLRQGVQSRQTWLLDIGTDVCIPVVAALSCSENGHQFACGLSSRLSLPMAARAAILELCQMELAVLLAEARAVQQGEMQLGIVERQTLERSRLDALHCELLHPIDAGASYTEIEGDSELAAVSNRLRQAGIDVVLVDLTRPESDISTVRAIAPKLQLMPSGHISQRLERFLADTGGGARFVGSIPLM